MNFFFDLEKLLKKMLFDHLHYCLAIWKHFLLDDNESNQGSNLELDTEQRWSFKHNEMKQELLGS